MLKHIQDMVIFALLVKNGSYTRTASELGMTKARISQRISDLEESLGLRLLNRTTRKFSLTGAGETYLASCRELLDACMKGDEIMQNLHNAVAGTLKIISPPGFMSSMLPAVHRDFLLKYPEVALQLETADSFYGTVGDSFDIAYRIGKPSDDGYIGRFLGSFKRFIVASPAYASAHRLTHPDEILRCELITHRTWKSIGLYRGDAHYDVVMPLRHTSDNLTYIMHQALIGTGLAILPEYIVKPYLASRQLQIVLADWQVQKIELWMIYQSKINNPAILREYINFVIKYNILDTII
ncbi:LysR family transcriptional regulator [Pluralibacter gergoviae]|uniref:LysR family transcriptional regulator n=2 Tax=Pluralibacter gergoviae TaxID=61647 RepID=A0AAW8HK96_PLUGE|nr:LysR family transcriptional regulator [Pluralibacter gergoviae]AVR05049.1 LysR family transcriptional regulator [Pluralibacter gergoviae]MDQ2309050.1 LysR family transcriptional regulator [Pluralibacter gergoviae]